MKANIIATLVSSLLISTIANAESCPESIKRLYQVSQSFSLRDSFINSATIALFEETFGQAERSLTADSKIQYSWTCPEDNVSSVTVISKDGTHVDSLSGVMKTPDGSMDFSLAAQNLVNPSTNRQSAQQNQPAQPTDMEQPTGPTIPY